MDYKLELVKILKHCIENRNFLMNSEGDIDKGARSVYQEIRIMIDEVLERAQAEPSSVPQANELLPHVSNPVICPECKGEKGEWLSNGFYTCNKCNGKGKL